MREFVYFSKNAVTTGNFKDLMKAGRMDIVLHVIIASFFLSNDVRKDMKLHLIFYGMPDPPKHIEIQIKPGLDISKKDVAGLIKRILYKYREGKKTEVFPGCFVEKKSFLKIIQELQEQGKDIFILDKKGEDIRKVKIDDDCVFVLGDQDGLPVKELKRLKKTTKKVSVGPRMYFASQTVSVMNNELDRRNI
ncbi:tRNA (pseudouridine(54)-N(1))-methyltransferase TrmY [Nanoarchaeota archaeon]